jgi:hypothetical protein
MGNRSSRTAQVEAPLRIALLGLSGAGKGTILHKWTLPAASGFSGATVEHTLPTIGFPVKVLQKGDSTVYSWDTGRNVANRLVPLLRHYFEDLSGESPTPTPPLKAPPHKALVWVISAADICEPDDASMLESNLRDMHAVLDLCQAFPVLFVLSKSDLPCSVGLTSRALGQSGILEHAKTILDWPMLTSSHRMVVDMVSFSASPDQPAEEFLPLLQWVKDNHGQLARSAAHGKPTKSAQSVMHTTTAHGAHE